MLPLRPIAEKDKIPFYEVDALPGKRIGDYYSILKEIRPDLILVMGWYYMVPKRIRELAKVRGVGNPCITIAKVCRRCSL